MAVENANTNGIRGLCLDPADLAISKLAAGRPKDLDFVRVLLREKIVLPRVLRERIDQVARLSEATKGALQQVVARLAA